jgi:enoyl-CoA hydratase
MPVKDGVRYEARDGVGWITLDRPEARNAIDEPMLRRLFGLLEDITRDDGMRGVIVTGAGETFCAGADIARLHACTPLEAREFARLAVTVNHRLETLGKVVIAAVNGHALGGGLELAEACTLRVAARGAKLGHPEVRLGAVSGFGGTTRLPRLVGPGKAVEMLLTGDPIDAEEACRIGLVNRVVDDDRLLETAEALVLTIAAQSALAVRLTWEAMRRGLQMTAEESTLLGADYFGLAAAGEDFREGTRAFLDKAKPSFTGR